MLEIQRFPIQQAINTLVMNSGAPKSKGTVSPPNQPSNLRATVVGGNRIDLQWTDNSWNETGFTLERKINGVFTPIATVGANVTRYSDTGLSSTANVGYRVKANNAIGSSGYADRHGLQRLDRVQSIRSQRPHADLLLLPVRQPELGQGSKGVRSYNLEQRLEPWPGCNDQRHGGRQGGYGRFYIYFFYRDPKNWYRVSTGTSGQGPANYVSQFEKSINGTISRIGTTGEGVNIGNGSMMQTWRVVVSHTGRLQFFTNNNAKGNPYPTMHQVLNVSDTLSFDSGKIGLGTNIGQPVWDNFSFDAASGGVTTRRSASAKGSP